MTRQNFATTVDRFLKALAAKDLTLRTARVEDVREAIGAEVAPQFRTVR